jgi:RNHCP domain
LKRAQSFRCHHCRLDVPTDAPGTAHRNHCPNCLWSRHVDDDPGDRASDCLASMEPIAITVRKDGEWILIHRCHGCGTLSSNRTAADDNPLLLLRIAVKPLAQPPFPLDALARL